MFKGTCTKITHYSDNFPMDYKMIRITRFTAQISVMKIVVNDDHVN